MVCATDAGREGELIFRYIYEAAGCQKPFSRLWISSLTPDAIRRGFDDLRPGGDTRAGRCGARTQPRRLAGGHESLARLLPGLRRELSVGRVQTPTLAMVVERELAIRNFVPEDYLEVWRHSSRDTPRTRSIKARGSREPGRIPSKWPCGCRRMARRRSALSARARTGSAAIESIESETQRMAPPLFYDLTELQRHANRLFGFSAQKTLETAQTLYEHHKLISYPRTDSRHLSQDVAGTLAAIVRRWRRLTGALWRQAPASVRWAGASWTMPRSPITTPSSPPRTRRGSRLSPTSGRSTI